MKKLRPRVQAVETGVTPAESSHVLCCLSPVPQAASEQEAGSHGQTCLSLETQFRQELFSGEGGEGGRA